MRPDGRLVLPLPLPLLLLLLLVLLTVVLLKLGHLDPVTARAQLACAMLWAATPCPNLPSQSQSQRQETEAKDVHLAVLALVLARMLALLLASRQAQPCVSKRAPTAGAALRANSALRSRRAHDVGSLGSRYCTMPPVPARGSGIALPPPGRAASSRVRSTMLHTRPRSRLSVQLFS